MPADLTGGIEFNHDKLHDKATDAQKYRDAALAEDPAATGDRLQQLIEKYTPAPLHQVVNIASAYVQNEWKTSSGVSSSVGAWIKQYHGQGCFQPPCQYPL